MDELPTDVLLSRMFAARTVTLVAGAVLVIFAGFAALVDPLYISLAGTSPLWEIVAQILSIGVWGALFVVLASSPFVWYYVFCVGMNAAGPKYAIGHLLLCMVLTPVCLTGIVFIPILVDYDIERWQQSGDGLTTEEAETS